MGTVTHTALPVLLPPDAPAGPCLVLVASRVLVTAATPGGEQGHGAHTTAAPQTLLGSAQGGRSRSSDSLCNPFLGHFETFCLPHRSFVLLVCPFSFSFGGKCIIFQTFSETRFQPIIHYQDDT